MPTGENHFESSFSHRYTADRTDVLNTCWSIVKTAARRDCLLSYFTSLTTTHSFLYSNTLRRIRTHLRAICKCFFRTLLVPSYPRSHGVTLQSAPERESERRQTCIRARCYRRRHKCVDVLEIQSSYVVREATYICESRREYTVVLI